MAQSKSFPGGSPEAILKAISSGKKPLDIQAKILKTAIVSLLELDEAALMELLKTCVQQMSAQNTSAEAEATKAQYEEALEALRNGPLRPGTFVERVEGDVPSPMPRVAVVTPDGQERFPVLLEGLDPEDLQPGMTVYLDANGGVVLGTSSTVPDTGPTAEFLRRLPGTQTIEVAVQGERPLVLRASRKVLEAVEDKSLTHGGRVIISPQREFAFGVIPGKTDRNHRFVDASNIPEVVAGRDIGDPHWALGWLIRRCRILLFRPDLLERFDLRPRVSLLMTGPSGVGKTLHIRAFLWAFNGMLKKLTGRDDLGTRVIRVKVSEQLSEWLGRSEKNFEELFNDLRALASETFQTADGEMVLLPVVCILEEVEALGRTRGEHNGQLHDRILGTLLQRLDDPNDDLGSLPIILISSSNRPDLIDAALLRRLANVRAHFGRLDQAGVSKVLSKKIKESYPMASNNGHSPLELRRALIGQIVGWLYSANGEDPGVVEITLADGKKLTKHRRDFLTGALVEQAVSSAIDDLVFGAEESGRAHEAGFTPAALIDCFRRQIDAIADTLTRSNVAEHLDLPEHTAVANVRRLLTPKGQLASVVVTEN